MLATASAPKTTAHRSARRSTLKPTIPLPRVADGWTPACRTIVVSAYADALCESVDGVVATWVGPVPTLDLGNVMLGACNLSLAEPDLKSAALFGAISEAIRFLGLE